jgi:DNA-binding Xre family transcriptional regulator
MTVTYNKLCKLMIDKSISKIQLRTQAVGISINAMAKLDKNEAVHILKF